MARINRELIDIMINGTPAQRMYIAEQEPMYFAIYYFPEFFNYEIPDFHLDFYEDIKGLANGDLEEVAWIAFRESAKTSIAKYAFILWCICFKKKRYINFDSYDKGNAESALFDIVVALQTNKKLIADFGELYARQKSNKVYMEAKLKRINNFITENDVRVEAFSTQEPTRGRIYKHQRPDLFVMDDIENNKTKESYPVTNKIISHYNEMKAGLGPNGAILVLGNYLSEDGVIAHILNNLKNRDNVRIRNIPVMNVRGEILWPDKYVKTKAEALIKNKEREKDHIVISLEAKKESLKKQVYATEMMNDPASSGDYYFDRGIIRTLLEKASEHIRDLGGMKIWKEYNPKHAYGTGADTAEGIGGDSSAFITIDFRTRPNQVVATYSDNLVQPNVFASAIKKGGDVFGEPFLIPEINGPGYATIAELVTLGYEGIYMREQKNKANNRVTKEFGWRTTHSTKSELIGNLQSAVEDGDLVIWDEGLLKEMLHYRRQDLRILKPEEGMTQHFDKVMAAALAWEARLHASSKEEDKKLFVLDPKSY